ncbi:ABC transporter permease subunit [Paenibacillus albicereus]|uniref:ABC transporter permease subunit n=1 Tax=Paenibacillus albicereus TaxID=2726185 RepID=A0A6H2H1M9_9BACL|nr:ABC transporter permease subunit [Paenibacillus albicereus]QJC53562.1 ABC transporter permease subunit [Paenibacillus albicereus]
MSSSPVDPSRPQHRTGPGAAASVPDASGLRTPSDASSPLATSSASTLGGASAAGPSELRDTSGASAPGVAASAAGPSELRDTPGASAPGVAASAAGPRAAARTARLRRWREQALGYAFLAPSLAVFAVFLFYPMLRSIYLSFQLTDPRGRVAAYAGWDNYTGMLQSSAFWNSLLVTLQFTLLTVPAGLALGLLCASLVHSAGRGRSALRFLFSLPLAMSVSTASIIWMILYHPSLGMLNYLLLQLGLDPVQWLTDPGSALGSVSLMTVWMNSGFPFVLLLAAIQGLDGDVLDSTRIDGASGWRTFVSVKLPLLSPTLFFLAVVSVMSAFQSFGQIHILTKGGPAGSTDVLVYSIYREAFVNYQFGTGSALAIVLFAIMLLLTLVQFLVLGKKVHYQ